MCSKPSCDLSLKHKVEPRRPLVTHRRQADGRTRTHAQVHRRLSYGHQGIRHIGSHHREAACSMGPHGYRLTCLGASLSVPAPHSLRTANFGPVGPMCQSGGSCVYVELSYGLSWDCIPSSGLLRLAWQQLDSCIVNLGAGWPHTVPRRRSSNVPRVCVRWSQESKWDLQPIIPMTQYLLLDVYYKG